MADDHHGAVLFLPTSTSSCGQCIEPCPLPVHEENNIERSRFQPFMDHPTHPQMRLFRERTRRDLDTAPFLSENQIKVTLKSSNREVFTLIRIVRFGTNLSKKNSDLVSSGYQSFRKLPTGCTNAAISDHPGEIRRDNTNLHNRDPSTNTLNPSRTNNEPCANRPLDELRPLLSDEVPQVVQSTRK